MRTEEKTLEVSLVKRVCPTCTKEVDAEIVMNTRLTTFDAKNVKEMHGKVVGMLDHPCEDCKKAAPDGIYFVGIDPEKGGKQEHELWRTGNVIALKKSAVKRMMPDADISKGYTYCQDSLIESIKQAAGMS